MEGRSAKIAGGGLMITHQHIADWGEVAPWNDQIQVEQDLIISRMLVDIFSDEFLRSELRFRGGTALNKLHFPSPLRFSEDIDLVRVRQGKVGPILDHIRHCIEPWIGKHPKITFSHFLAKLFFRAETKNEETGAIRIKIEINTRENLSFDPPVCLPFTMENPWFSGEAMIPTYSREEMLATKLRALLQRNKGRDLYDLSYALEVFEDLDIERVIDLFGRYLEASEHSISKAEAQLRMFQKYNEWPLLVDIHSLLPIEKSKSLTEEVAEQAFWNVFDNIVSQLPGSDWVGLDEFLEQKGNYS